MQIQFTENGESPDIGIFAAGDIKLVPDDIAKIMIHRGIAKEAGEGIAPSRQRGQILNLSPKKEVKDNG